MVRVFTKYDTIPTEICEPYIRFLAPCELWDGVDMANLEQSGYMTHRTYSIKNIADGLAGVKFVHYEVTV